MGLCKIYWAFFHFNVVCCAFQRGRRVEKIHTFVKASTQVCAVWQRRCSFVYYFASQKSIEIQTNIMPVKQRVKHLMSFITRREKKNLKRLFSRWKWKLCWYILDIYFESKTYIQSQFACINKRKISKCLFRIFLPSAFIVSHHAKFSTVNTKEIINELYILWKLLSLLALCDMTYARTYEIFNVRGK
jgi:hypothetical protein